MKKHLLLCLFATMTMGSVFTSCSDDDEKDAPVVCPIEKTTFNGSNGLELTYGGEALLGKQVVFTPNVADHTKATLTLSGAALSIEGLPITLPGAGVVPGEKTTVLEVENIVTNGDAISFEGVNETENRVVKFNGTANKSGLKLNLDVVMASNILSGKTFNLVPMTQKPTALHLNWVADEFKFSGGTWDIQSAILMTVGLFPVVDGMNALEALAAVLKNVSFLEDGNIVAEYKDQPKDENWKTSPVNLATYTVQDNKIKLFLNPEQIIYIATKASKSSRASIAELIPALLEKAGSLLENGITLHIGENEGATTFYLDMEELMPILQMVKPLFQDEEIIKMLVELIAEAAGPDMAPLVQLFVPDILVALPIVIDTTKELQIGLNFTEAE